MRCAGCWGWARARMQCSEYRRRGVSAGRCWHGVSWSLRGAGSGSGGAGFGASSGPSQVLLWCLCAVVLDRRGAGSSAAH
eukprot:7929718-Alexandrium_andersonii.AAC.1